jgi:hypothetical protein
MNHFSYREEVDTASCRRPQPVLRPEPTMNTFGFGKRSNAAFPLLPPVTTRDFAALSTASINRLVKCGDCFRRSRHIRQGALHVSERPNKPLTSTDVEMRRRGRPIRLARAIVRRRSVQLEEGRCSQSAPPCSPAGGYRSRVGGLYSRSHPGPSRSAGNWTCPRPCCSRCSHSLTREKRRRTATVPSRPGSRRPGRWRSVRSTSGRSRPPWR